MANFHPSVGIIGGRGLVGSALTRHLHSLGIEARLIGRSDANTIESYECDILIYANGNASKWKARENPAWDFDASVRTVSHYLHAIRHETFVHISTVDVYPDPSDRARTLEHTAIDRSAQSPYGFHKLLAEDVVKRYSPKHLITRLPALVGPGLKKNPIYDYFAPDKSLMIAPESTLNVVHTDDIAKKIWSLLECGISNRTFNLVAPDSVSMKSLEPLTGVTGDYIAEATECVQTYNLSDDALSEFGQLGSSSSAIQKYYEELMPANNQLEARQ